VSAVDRKIGGEKKREAVLQALLECMLYQLMTGQIRLTRDRVREEDNAAGGGEMAKEIIFLVEDTPEGGYLAQALGYSIFTEADTREQLKQAVRDAVEYHFDQGQRPDLIRPVALSSPKFGRGEGERR